MTHDLVRRAFALAFLLVAGPGAAVADSLQPPYAADFDPGSFTRPTADGFWAFGSVSGRPMYARFDAGGRITSTFPYASGYGVTTFNDGGLFVSSGCEAQRLEPQGVLGWRNPTLPSTWACTTPAVDAARNTWVRGACAVGCGGEGRVLRLDARGVTRATWEFFDPSPNGAPQPIAGATVGAGAWAAVGGSLVRVDPDGVPRVGANFNASTRFTQIAVDPQDRAWGFGVQEGTATQAPMLAAMYVSPAGAVFQRLSRETLARPRLVAVDANINGAVAMVGDATFEVGTFGEPIYRFAALRVHRFDPGGFPTWTRDLVPDPGCYYCSVSLTANGDVLIVAGRNVPATAGATRLQRVASDNTVTSEVEVAGALWNVREQPDGSVLALASDTAFTRRFVRWSRSGQALPVPATGDATPGQAELLSSHFERSGAAETLSLDRAEPRLFVTGYAADGSVAWRRDAAETVVTSIVPTGNTEMDGNGRRTCWSALQRLTNQGHTGELVVECLDPASGALRFRRSVGDALTTDPMQLVVAADDSVVIAYRQGGGAVRRARFAADGSALASQVFDGFTEAVAHNTRGEVLLADRLGDRVALVDIEGSVRWTHALGAEGDDGTRAHAVSESGGAAFIATQRALTVRVPRLVLLSPTGDELWRTNLQVAGNTAETAFYGNDPVLGDVSFAATISTRRVARYDATTGVRRWGWQREDAYGQTPDLVVDAATGSVALGIASAERLRLVQLDAATGEPRVDRSVPCSSSYCNLDRLAIDATGGLRYAETADFEYSRPSGPRWRLGSIAAPPPAPRVDQAGIAGAWYPEYVTGQGLFVEWLPASRVLFSTWFTYATSVNSPAALQWYSLQGDVADSARSATVGIYENADGRFATPPATTAQRVGTATFALEDCGRASLDYEFTAGSRTGSHGRYSLRRLTQPRGCVSGTGAVTAPPAPVAGFDARQSGAWFSPATSGQGLDLSITPGESVFGAWFTYDPDGNADDDAAQHWFTLQGSLVGTSGGRVFVPLYSTIGGDFDRTPTRNTFLVGDATLTFTACNRATLEYRFLPIEAAGAFSGRTGTIALERLGGCEP